MSVTCLIADLFAQGVLVSANGDKLRVEAPADLLTTDLRALLTIRKTELLSALRGNWQAAVSALIAHVPDQYFRADLHYQFDERAGIFEYEGNMPRPQAERMAYEHLTRVIEKVRRDGG